MTPRPDSQPTPAWVVDHPVVGYDAVLAGSARAFGERIAFVDGDAELTFAQLHDRARRVAAGLRAHGIGPGDVVALHQPTSLWHPIVYSGVLLSGAAACGVNHLLPPDALAEQVSGLGATAIITHADCPVPAAVIALPGVRLRVGLPGGDGTAVVGADVVPIEDLLSFPPLESGPLDPDSLAHLQLTGGTTGTPKGVRILHRNLVSHMVLSSHPRAGGVPTLDDEHRFYFDPVPGTVPEDSELGTGVAISVAPPFHASGLMGIMANILLGMTTVIRRRFDPDEYFQDIEELRLSRVLAVPTLLQALLDSPLAGKTDTSSVRHILSGAAPIDTTTLERLAVLFPKAKVSEVYGLSEATSVLTMQIEGRGSGVVVGSVGVAAPNTVVELRDPDGHRVAQGEVGEIWGWGPQVADGYHGDPELTADQFRDGWVRTGDLGTFDEHGNLFIVGRSKDVVIYKGYNVYPKQLEELLIQHPSVGQCAVVGRPVPIVGEIPVAFVVPACGAAIENSDEVIARVNEKVVPYQRLREVHVVDALPLTAVAKVDKVALRKLLAHV